MPNGQPYQFGRYFFTVREQALTAFEQRDELSAKNFLGRPFPHRKSDPSPEDADTFAMEPKLFERNGFQILTWKVGFYVKQRQDQMYDSENDRSYTNWTETDAIKSARLVAVPALGVIAVEDRSSDTNIPASSALGRMTSIVRRGIKYGEFGFEMGATLSDVEAALEDWEVEELSFTVRPFNPHPSDPGMQLHELMDADNIGRITGKATPAEEELIQPSEDGFTGEVVGLSKGGYATFGVKGRDQAGREIKVNKPKFDMDRRKNLAQLKKRMPLRVTIDPDEDGANSEIDEVADALLAMYDKS